MARKGLSMRKVREILRLRWELGLSVHKVAKSCKVSPSTVLEYERRAQAAGLSWPLPEGVDDGELEHLLAGSPPPVSDRRGLPEVAYLLEEMRKPHVTLMLLWMEYKAAHPDGYQYTQFWRYYQEGKKRLEVALRPVPLGERSAATSATQASTTASVDRILQTGWSLPATRTTASRWMVTAPGTTSFRARSSD